MSVGEAKADRLREWVATELDDHLLLYFFSLKAEHPASPIVVSAHLLARRPEFFSIRRGPATRRSIVSFHAPRSASCVSPQMESVCMNPQPKSIAYTAVAYCTRIHAWARAASESGDVLSLYCIFVAQNDSGKARDRQIGESALTELLNSCLRFELCPGRLIGIFMHVLMQICMLQQDLFRRTRMVVDQALSFSNCRIAVWPSSSARTE
jgi:hypothetical protein